MCIKIYNTLIVGAGMAGIGCAKTLVRNGDEGFLVLSTDIGGRVPCSEDGDVNYGAYYVRSDYEHIMPYIRKKRRIWIWKYFIVSNHWSWFFLWSHIRHLPSLVRFACLSFYARRRYILWKKRSEYVSQKEAFEMDPFLLKYYKMPAKKLVRDMRLQFWTKHYLNPLCRFTSFADYEDLTAAYFIGCAAPLFVPTYEFHLYRERLIEDIFDHVTIDEVVEVQKSDDGWVVSTASSKKYKARHLVMATPIHISKKMVSIPEEYNKGIDVHMVHLRGELRSAYRNGNYIMFPRRSKDIVLTREGGGSYMLYTYNADYDLSKYFKEYEVIAKRYWNPALRVGPHLIEAKRGDNLFVIGDAMICGIEDAYISGVYAANCIIGSA